MRHDGLSIIMGNQETEEKINGLKIKYVPVWKILTYLSLIYIKLLNNLGSTVS